MAISLLKQYNILNGDAIHITPCTKIRNALAKAKEGLQELYEKNQCNDERIKISDALSEIEKEIATLWERGILK